jgi:hypothetical protein
MNQADLILDLPSISSEPVSSTALPILIAVPKIKVRRGAGSQRVAQPDLQSSGRTVRRGRRRLRREVRFAGCALLALVPIASACTLGWSNRPDRFLACSISDPNQTTADSGGFANAPRLGVGYQLPQPIIASSGTIALSINPAVAIPETVSEAPVILPGYVLPDDSREDSVHEGS